MYEIIRRDQADDKQQNAHCRDDAQQDDPVADLPFALLLPLLFVDSRILESVLHD